MNYDFIDNIENFNKKKLEFIEFLNSNLEKCIKKPDVNILAEVDMLVSEFEISHYYSCLIRKFVRTIKMDECIVQILKFLFLLKHWSDPQKL
jgi:hypothetical protein